MSDTWIWTLPPSSTKSPFAEYDHCSAIHSSHIVGTEPIFEPTLGDIEVLLRRTRAVAVEGFGCLPNSTRCPLVDEAIASIIEEFAAGDFQLLPVVVHTNDAEVTRYSFARPLVSLPCLDLEISDIDDWIIPGEVVMDARLLVFRRGCLGAHHFARDSYTAHVVVSEELKNALSETGDKGLYFSRPEDMWNIFKD